MMTAEEAIIPRESALWRGMTLRVAFARMAAERVRKKRAAEARLAPWDPPGCSRQ
jgi:hypothetical protein